MLFNYFLLDILNFFLPWLFNLCFGTFSFKEPLINLNVIRDGILPSNSNSI